MTTPAIYFLYTKIVITALAESKIKLNKCRRDFMIEIFMLYLSIPSRINFLQLGRYSSSGEQRFRRQFEKGFNFFSFNKALAMPWIGSRNAVAFDPSFIHKSGKQPPSIVRGCSLDLVSKLRNDADLAYLSLQPRTGRKGRPTKYAGKIDVKNLNLDYFKQVKNNNAIKAY